MHMKEDDQFDAARYRHLMAHHVHMTAGSRDGPSYPLLTFWADLWNERSDLSARERLQQKLDQEIAAIKGPAP